MTLKPGLRVTQGHRNRHGSIRHLWFPITFHCNHAPISYCFRNIRRFQSKIAKIFPPTFYFASPLKGFPLELDTGAGVKKTRVMGLPDRQRSLTISSAVWIECTNVTDRQTDRRTDGHGATAKTALTHSVAWWKSERDLPKSDGENDFWVASGGLFTCNIYVDENIWCRLI